MAAENSTALQEATRGYDNEVQEWQIAIGNGRKIPRPEFWKALERLIDVCCKKSAVQDYQHTHIAELIKQYLKFLSLDDDQRIVPTRDLLTAVQLLKEAMPFDNKRTERVKELLELPGMSLEQVANMHGLPISTIGRMHQLYKDKKDGLADELYPKNHITPEERRRLDVKVANAKRFRDAVQDWKERPVDGHDAEKSDEWTAPPESIEELLSLPGMTVEQVATMHRKPVAEIQAIKDGMQFSPDLTDDNIDAEIRTCASQGCSEQEIMEILGIDQKRVQSVTKALQKQPA